MNKRNRVALLSSPPHCSRYATPYPSPYHGTMRPRPLPPLARELMIITSLFSCINQPTCVQLRNKTTHSHSHFTDLSSLSYISIYYSSFIITIRTTHFRPQYHDNSKASFCLTNSVGGQRAQYGKLCLERHQRGLKNLDPFSKRDAVRTGTCTGQNQCAVNHRNFETL